jgi:hypothetical protein
LFPPGVKTIEFYKQKIFRFPAIFPGISNHKVVIKSTSIVVPAVSEIPRLPGNSAKTDFMPVHTYLIGVRGKTLSINCLRVKI